MGVTEILRFALDDNDRESFRFNQSAKLEKKLNFAEKFNIYNDL